jgi:hypothetical protein
MLFKALVAQATIGCLFLLFPGEFKWSFVLSC